MKCTKIFPNRVFSIIIPILSCGIIADVVRSQHFGKLNDDEDPVINLGSWKENDFESEWHTNSSPPLGATSFPNAVFVPSTLRGLSLICNASYPIEWKFHRERWGGRSRIQFAIQTTRISDGLDVRSFSTELSILGFDSSVSGNYTCQKVGYEKQSASMYIFWEGASPPFLTLARSYRKPAQIPFQLKSKSFVLPCTVAVPNVVPNLTKTVGGKEIELQQNRSVKYDPRIGFTLTNLKAPFGRYMCQVGDSEENENDADVITFDVIDAYDGPKPEFNDTITRSGAFLDINSTKKEITCCSSSPKPPRLKLVECDHPTVCALAKHTLHRMESSKRKNGSCSIVNMRTLRAGIFRCVGDGIDVVREYFYPMPEQPTMPVGPPRKGGGRGHRRRPGKTSPQIVPTLKPSGPPPPPLVPYFSWNEAEMDKMMAVTKLTRPVYVGENRTFFCKASHFYYSQGIVWGITYLNQSVIEYADGQEYTRQIPNNWHGLAGNRHFQIIYGKNMVTIQLTISSNLSSLICYAPVWNSTEWGKKQITMEVKVPTAPTVKGALVKDLTWYLNDTNKYLECSFDGDPIPKVIWKKGNFTLKRKSSVVVNGTSQLAFSRVGPRAEGEYVCIIWNVAGNVTRKFKVAVLQSNSSTLTVVLVLSLLGFTATSIALGFLCNYLKSQKSVISHLTNLAFKDVTGTNGGSGGGGAGGEFQERRLSFTNTNGAVLPPTAPTVVLPEKDIPISGNQEMEQNETLGNGFLSTQSNHHHHHHTVIHHTDHSSQDGGMEHLQPPVSFDSFRKF